MKNTNFLTLGPYISLPSKHNPKVLLSAKSKNHTSLALNLYNPFTFKAKVYKFFINLIFVHFNFISKKFFTEKKSTKSDFITFLENAINTRPITSSVYFSTVKEKVVIQIQSCNKIIGYIKFPLNQIGTKNILNEKKAIDILSKQNLIDKYILFNYYKKSPFILLKPINGQVSLNTKINIRKTLNQFKKNNKFLLRDHPRILQLMESLKIAKLYDYTNVLENACNASTLTYHEVYEHGDFAPWNIIKDKNNFFLFDFEYFEENGLEYLDEIKYFFQIEYLLKGKTDFELIEILSNKLNLNEFNSLMTVFLLKEIIIKKQNLENFDMYDSLIKIITND
jgi:hypothetical protein